MYVKVFSVVQMYTRGPEEEEKDVNNDEKEKVRCCTGNKIEVEKIRRSYEMEDPFFIISHLC